MPKNLFKIAKEKKIKYFLISFVDLFGVLRSKLVPTRAIKEMQEAGAGFAGFVGLVICGFVLNGYPSSGYSVGAMWDGTTYASINPLGQFLGAIIMFGVLGMLPGYVIAKVLHGMGKLRIPRDVEIAGLDYEMMESAKKDERTVSSATR